jgi:hypothetical protein
VRDELDGEGELVARMLDDQHTTDLEHVLAGVGTPTTKNT